MPKIAIYKIFTFYILSFDLGEPYHVHVIKSKGYNTKAAKIWLEGPSISEKGNLTNKELNMVLRVIEENKEKMIHQINNFAKGQKVTTLKFD